MAVMNIVLVRSDKSIFLFEAEVNLSATSQKIVADLTNAVKAEIGDLPGEYDLYIKIPHDKRLKDVAIPVGDLAIIPTSDYLDTGSAAVSNVRQKRN